MTSECPDFCCEFIQDLQPVELQNKVVEVIHCLVQRKCTDAWTTCEGLLKEIGGSDGKAIDALHYDSVLKQLSLALLKVSENNVALRLVNERLNSCKNDDFMTLMTLGVIYDKTSDYDNALETYKRANDVANTNQNEVQKALSLVKMATSYWHSEHPELAQHCIRQGEQSLRCYSVRNVSGVDVHFLVDYYKTMGYLSKMTYKRKLSLEYYLKALDVIQKQNYSLVQELKILSQISLCCALVGKISELHGYRQRVLELIEETLKNPQCLSSHVGQITRIMNRLSFSCKVMNKLDLALEISEKSLDIARSFLGDAHPEVPRIAADSAVLCQQLNKPRRAVEFLDISENSLNEINYKNDDEKINLYVRELTDAISHIGQYYLLQSNYAAAEETFQEGLAINVKVYGEMSLRTSKMMRYLGITFCRWGKYDLAKKYFRKSLTVIETYQPKNLKMQKIIKEELAYCRPKLGPKLKITYK